MVVVALHTKLTLFGMSILFVISVLFVIWYYADDLALMISLGNCKNTTMFTNLIDLGDECKIRKRLGCYSKDCPFNKFEPYKSVIKDNSPFNCWSWPRSDMKNNKKTTKTVLKIKINPKKCG